MFKTRFISMLVLLLMAVSGARAAWTGGTYTATATENLGAITVNADATLTINEGVTVTVNGGINVASGTLTVTGPGTLVVTGAKGNDGGFEAVGGTGGVAISGNIIVQGGATVTATGGTGGSGGNGDYRGGNGGNGGVAISDNIIVQGGATVTATGGTGGTGGNGDAIGGNGGNGGNAFAGTLTYKSGTVTANGGSGGSGGLGVDWEIYSSSGYAGNAFANEVTFLSGYVMTNGSNQTINSATGQRQVIIYEPIPVTGVTLSQTEATLTAGETVTLTATVEPSNATYKSVTWTTSDANVATVTNAGVVSAVGGGIATITATATNGTDDTSDDKTATCTVSVHTHSFAYQVNGATITATCKGKDDNGIDCTLENLTASLTIEASKTGAKLTGDTQVFLPLPTINYYNANNDDTRGDALDPITTAPTAIGKYWAEFTLGDQTAHVVYDIVPSASIGDTDYPTFADAINAVADGETIKLQEDITGTFTFNKSGVTATLDLNGHTIDGDQKGIVFTIKNGTLILDDSSDGAPGIITGGYSTGNNGGGVLISGGTFTMKNGSIEGNQAGNGGGVCLSGSGVFNMLGGTIQYNVATTYTAGVFVNGSNNFTMSGGVIQYNVGKGFGGVGIANAQPNFSGTAVVKDNVIFTGGVNGKLTKTDSGYTIADGGTPSDVHHATGNGLQIHIVGTLTTGAKIGVYNNNQTNAFTTGYNTYNSSDVATKFFFSNAGGKVIKKNDSGELVLAELNAENVTEMINALPDAADVTIADTDAIEAARAAYEALTDEQKAGVSAETLKKLTDAEAALVPATYTVTLKEGTDDATSWTIAPAEATTTGVAAGTEVKATYSGTKKVKSVKAVKKAAANPNAYMKWDNTKKELVEAEIPAGATTETNADTNVEWAAGTYVVEGDVTINGNITLGGNVDLIIKDGAKLTVNGRIHGSSSKYNLSIYGQANQSGQLVVNNPSNDAIVSITTLEVHSCQVTASSSGNNRGGFYGIVTFNVYGGSVDAENTGATSGYGIYLSSSGSMNIYGGDVKAVGKGDNSTYSYGITGSSSITVTVYGGKLWAENADQKAIKNNITLAKGAGFTGKTETSDNGTSWTDLTTEGTPDAKYVRVGY